MIWDFPVDQMKAPNITEFKRVVAGVDWGFVHAFACEVVGQSGSGRLSVVLAAACFAAALALPLLGGLSIRSGGEFQTDVTVRPWDLAMGTYPALRGRLSAWLLPGAALFLASLLRSRRTAPMMVATRPLLGAMSLAPVVSLVLPIVRLRDRGGHPEVGPALAVGALGVLLCWHAAAVFGNGMPEREPLPPADDEDDDA